MLRIIAGIIVGFIVMAVIVMGVFGITWAILGNDGAFQPNSYWTTTTFNIAVLIGGTIAAVIGGWVCTLIARKHQAAFGFAGMVLAMGIGSAIGQMNRPDPPARTGEITFEDVQKHGKEPTWFAFSKAIAGGLGVVIGSGMVRRKSSTGAG